MPSGLLPSCCVALRGVCRLILYGASPAAAVLLVLTVLVVLVPVVAAGAALAGRPAMLSADWDYPCLWRPIMACV